MRVFLQSHSTELDLDADNQLLPLSNYGVKTMSMGYLVGEDAPVVWRGLMVMKALQQLLHEVEWGGLDILVLDLPPGTGDTQLTVTQQIVLDGMYLYVQLQQSRVSAREHELIKQNPRICHRDDTPYTGSEGCGQGNQHVQKGQCALIGTGPEHVSVLLSKLPPRHGRLWFQWARQGTLPGTLYRFTTRYPVAPERGRRRAKG